jgi:hypothetical protein
VTFDLSLCDELCLVLFLAVIGNIVIAVADCFLQRFWELIEYLVNFAAYLGPSAAVASCV